MNSKAFPQQCYVRLWALFPYYHDYIVGAAIRIGNEFSRVVPGIDVPASDRNGVGTNSAVFEGGVAGISESATLRCCNQACRPETVVEPLTHSKAL